MMKWEIFIDIYIFYMVINIKKFEIMKTQIEAQEVLISFTKLVMVY